MAITSVGYAGTVSDEQWAKMVARVGSAFYSVDDFASFKVSAAAGTRTIQVATGGISGKGIYDLSSAAVTRSLGSVPSGVRWDLVVLRRTWATKLSDIVVIPGGSTKALPDRSITPGTVDDQPLALVRVAAGSTNIQEVVDLRCSVHNGGAIAWDDLARTYLNQLGTDLRIGDIMHSRVTDAGGSEVWVSSDMGDTGWVAVPLGPGWEAATGDSAGYRAEVRAVGPLVQMRGALTAKTALATVLNFGTVPAAFRPTKYTFLGAAHGSSDSTFVGELLVQPNGQLSTPSGYYHGGLGIGRTVPLHGSWFRG